jgi:DNA-binding NarL/FixJ family response regulator
VRVIVADDAVLLREGIMRILADEGYDVVAAVGSGPDLLNAARVYAPDLVLADVRMPPTHTHDGIEAVRTIRAERAGTAAVLLSQYVEATAAMGLFREDPAGLGYLLKDRIMQVNDFLEGVRRVAAGGLVMDPLVVAQLLGRTAGPDDPLGALTDRERDVLALMAQGCRMAASVTGCTSECARSRRTPTRSSRSCGCTRPRTSTAGSGRCSPTWTPRADHRERAANGGQRRERAARWPRIYKSPLSS